MPATITARGRVYIDGIQFTTDPEPYQPFEWEKRTSIHKVIGGKVVIQDFGLFAADNMLKLGSGSRYLIDTFVIDSIQAMYATGGSHTLTDWMGNAFTIFINRFRVWPNIVGPLYFYEMDCQTLTITAINSASYSGA